MFAKESFWFPIDELLVQDAVCFVSQAGSARLTPAQMYIFDKIITSFGFVKQTFDALVSGTVLVITLDLLI